MENLSKLIHQNNAQIKKLQVLRSIDRFIESRTDKVVGKRLLDAINEELKKEYGEYTYQQDWGDHAITRYPNVRVYISGGAINFDVMKLGKFYDQSEPDRAGYRSDINRADTRESTYIKTEKYGVKPTIEEIKSSIKSRIENAKIYSNEELTAAHKRAGEINESINSLVDERYELPYSWLLK